MYFRMRRAHYEYKLMILEKQMKRNKALLAYLEDPKNQAILEETITLLAKQYYPWIR
jgi:hypothetical protein